MPSINQPVCQLCMWTSAFKRLINMMLLPRPDGDENMSCKNLQKKKMRALGLIKRISFTLTNERALSPKLISGGALVIDIMCVTISVNMYSLYLFLQVHSRSSWTYIRISRPDYYKQLCILANTHTIFAKRRLLLQLKKTR